MKCLQLLKLRLKEADEKKMNKVRQKKNKKQGKTELEMPVNLMIQMSVLQEIEKENEE